jgi:hypothetical protein
MKLIQNNMRYIGEIVGDSWESNQEGMISVYKNGSIIFCTFGEVLGIGTVESGLVLRLSNY